jgi:hypothetical protein
MISDIGTLLDVFYDTKSPSSLIDIAGPLLEMLRINERCGKIALICSVDDIALVKIFPDGEMCVLQ